MMVWIIWWMAVVIKSIECLAVGIPAEIVVLADQEQHDDHQIRSSKDGGSSGPYLDQNVSDNVVIAQVGHSAFLKCTVYELGEQTVSWVRRRDWHILTSGRHVYTADERFQVFHTDGSDDWILQIQYVQERDAGTYLCQVSTAKGLQSTEVKLEVPVPEAFILGGNDFHVDHGSTISLVCIVEKSPVPPAFVFWYHNERMINFDSQRGGITVETEGGHRTHSQLRIRDARESDSGNYTCRASNSQPASIYVHVWGGDKAAAISGKNGVSSLNPWPFCCWPWLFSIPLTIWTWTASLGR